VRPRPHRLLEASQRVRYEACVCQHDRIARRSPAFRPEVQSPRLTHGRPLSIWLHPCCLKSWFAVVGDGAPGKTMSELALMFQIL
jgi:hypothetical protein